MKIPSFARNAYRKTLSEDTKHKLGALRGKARKGVGTLIGAFAARCQVCGGKKVSRYRNPAVARLLFPLFICRDCGFIFVYPTPDLSACYSDTQVPEMGEGEQLWNSYFLDSINKFAEHRGKLMEIGFGSGSFLKLAHEQGWDVYGVELSPLNVKQASEELELPNIHYGTVEDAGYPDNLFDVVAAFNFIEHVPDLRATLGQLRRVLRPGGLLVLLCPNISGIYHELVPEVFGDNDPLKITWIPPIHLSYFNKSNFKQLLESTGFQVLSDESYGTNLLWLQHKTSIGPQVTEEKFVQLVAAIRSSPAPEGTARVNEYREHIAELLRQRITWQFISDIMQLETSLGAENAIMYIGQKAAAEDSALKTSRTGEACGER